MWTGTHQRQRTVTPHTMSRNANPTLVQLRKRLKDRLGEFLGDVGVHVIALVIRGLCRVDVEASAGAEVPGVVFAFDVQAAFSRSFRQYVLRYP